MMLRALCTGVIVGAALMAPVAAAPSIAGAQPCGVDPSSPRVLAAVRTLAPYPGTDWAWSTNPATYDGNFDTCATLSTVLVPVAGATASSPVTALMFHRGDYLGTATGKAYGFTTVNRARTTDDTVVLSYATPGQCNACAPAAVTDVRYRWQGDRVVMLDPPPLVG